MCGGWGGCCAPLLSIVSIRIFAIEVDLDKKMSGSKAKEVGRGWDFMLWLLWLLLDCAAVSGVLRGRGGGRWN